MLSNIFQTFILWTRWQVQKKCHLKLQLLLLLLLFLLLLLLLSRFTILFSKKKDCLFVCLFSLQSRIKFCFRWISVSLGYKKFTVITFLITFKSPKINIVKKGFEKPFQKCLSMSKTLFSTYEVHGTILH